MRTAFIQTLCEEAKHDDRIWLLTGDLGYSVLESFANRYPDRYLNVGVAEQNMAGLAALTTVCGILLERLLDCRWLSCLAAQSSDARRISIPGAEQLKN